LWTEDFGRMVRARGGTDEREHGCASPENPVRHSEVSPKHGSERALEAQREDVRGERVDAGVQLPRRLRGARALVDAAAPAWRGHEHPAAIEDEAAHDRIGEP